MNNSFPNTKFDMKNLFNLKILQGSWITFAFILMFFQTNLFAQKPLEGKVILAAFAHPDDEMTVAPILARYAREGAKVHLVIVTDGRLGVNDKTDYVAGGGVVAMRQREMKCAASELGVELVHLKYHDQLKSGEGYDGHIPHVRSMIKAMHGIVEKLKPDVIITWGPEGGYAHIDHRLVSLTMTQIFTSRVWDRPTSLYYYGTPTESIEDPESKIIQGQDKKYLTTHVSYTEEDMIKAYNSVICHVSQLQHTRSWETYKAKREKNGKIIYLRKFVAPTKISDSVFD
jgi:LmbE family N-acetylglucosaminyl deacetylase